jgi:hypothetical protein
MQAGTVIRLNITRLVIIDFLQKSVFSALLAPSSAQAFPRRRRGQRLEHLCNMYNKYFVSSSMA